MDLQAKFLANFSGTPDMAHLQLMYVLKSVQKEGDKVTYAGNVRYLRKAVNLPELVERGFIRIEEDKVIIGSWTGNSPKGIQLLATAVPRSATASAKSGESSSDYSRKAIEALPEFRGSSKKSLLSYLEAPPSGSNLSRYFSAYYFHRFQAEYRNFAVKDRSVFAHLVGLFPYSDCIDLVTCYLENAEEFGTSYPSVAHLSAIKDIIKSKINEHGKKQERKLSRAARRGRF